MAAASELARVFDGWSAHTSLGEATAEIARGWLDDLFPERSGEWRLRPLGERKAVADSPARLMAVDRLGLPRAIVFVSTPKSPGLVARGAARASEAFELLGAEIGAAVLRPCRTGWVGGLSIAAYPWRLEVGHGFIRSRVRRPLVRAWLLKWLRLVTKVCVSRYPEAADRALVRESLGSLASCTLLTDRVRGLIDRAQTRLDDGSWKPRWVLDHNDFWPGNIMVNRDELARPTGPSPYVVIDWAGANLRGGGFVDLLRVAKSYGLGRARLEKEVTAHCGLLGITPEDSLSQAILSLGWLHRHLEYFPTQRFAELAEHCLITLSQCASPSR